MDVNINTDLGLLIIGITFLLVGILGFKVGSKAHENGIDVIFIASGLILICLSTTVKTIG